MHFTGLTFRPPYEADSILLQVTAGCSHNACTFCSMYRDVEFAVSPLEEVESDLQEIAAKARRLRQRVFLVNGDPFALSAERLEEIAKLIHRHLPYVTSIGCYAQVQNILDKTDDELRHLAELGYSNLNVGIESALDAALEYMNKGFTADEARVAMIRLCEAGIPFNMNIINGLAGPERAHEHALANAAFVNEMRPTLLFVSPLHVDEGTPLKQLVESGRFHESSLGEYIDEEIDLLRNLDVEGCVFYGMHVSNPVAVLGTIPQDKGRMLQELEEGKEEYGPELLASHPYKGSEGRILR